MAAIEPPETDRVAQLLRRRPPAAALSWAAGQFGPGSRVVSVRPLPSAWLANHAVEVADAAGALHRVVLRRWARPGWAEEDPDFTAAREAAILDLLAPTPVPAPTVVAADPGAAACDVPALLLTLLPGGPPDPRADPGRLVEGLAAALPPIHAVAVARDRSRRPPEPVAPGRPGARLPSVLRARAAGPAGLVGAARAVGGGRSRWRPGRRRPGQCFIHRDYHPGNTLWAEGRLTGVVDWVGGSWGPPSVDLGHMRLNLAWRPRPGAGRPLPGRPPGPDRPRPPSRGGTWPAAVDCVPELGSPGPPPEPWLQRMEELVAAALSRLGG